jgi:hypothetical protein
MQSTQNKPDKYRQNWINHPDTMTDRRILKQILQYKEKDVKMKEDFGNNGMSM